MKRPQRKPQRKTKLPQIGKKTTTKKNKTTAKIQISHKEQLKNHIEKKK